MNDQTVAFTLLGRPIYWYGVFFALGFIAAIIHWSRRAKRDGWPRDTGSDLSLWIMVFGILGARMAYVFANWDHFTANPAEIIRIDQGGLVYYGGMIGGTLGYLLYGLTKKINLLRLGDFAVSAIPLGHAFGRYGCHLNVCCYGKVTEAPWAVFMGDAYRHPTQLIEVLGNLCIYAFMLWIDPKLKRPGRLMVVYLLTYPVMRFSVEFLRGDGRLTTAGITTAQFTSLLLFSAGLLLLFFTRHSEPHDQAPASDAH